MWYEKDEAVLDRSDEASLKALELDPNLAEAHAARGHVLTLRKQYEEAEREFETAIRLDPTLYEAYYFYGRAALMQGKYEKSAQMFEGAIAVRPDDYQAPLLVTQVYRSLGREAEVRAAFDRGVRLVKKQIKLNPDDVRALVLGAHALMEVGETETADVWAKRALELSPDDRGVLYNLACYYSLSGEKETAIDCLEKAAAVGRVTREWIEHDSDLDPIREEPRYLALLEKI